MMAKDNKAKNRRNLFKFASKTTGTVWIAFLKPGPSGWEVADFFHEDKNRQVESRIRIGVEQKYCQAGGNDPLPDLKSTLLGDNDQITLGCKHVQLINATGSYKLLAGMNAAFSKDDIAIWKLLIPVLTIDNQPVENSQLDLLKNTVAELELTQQELRARIAAQREAEIRLIQAAKLAAVGEMAAGIAHELNNPLTSVVGFTELALEDLAPDASVRGDLEMVLKEARRASSVVRRLLDFSRQSETVRAKTDVNEIVDDVLVLSRHMIQSSKIQLETRLGEDLDWALIDRNQIKQVVINLLNNAINAMPSGGRILVQTGEQNKYGRKWITLLVEDSGIGIPAENLERIFEPFFTTRGERGGTGLGLSVTYGIVTDHGGMIEVESQVNVGSKFVVWLPLEE